MITLYSGLVVKQPLEERIIPLFQEHMGLRISTVFEPTTMLLQRVSQGERPDLLLGTADSLAGLADDGVLSASSVTDIAISSVGFAHAPGSAEPADDSAEAFLDYLVSARAVAYSLSGASGQHFMRLMRKYGLLERIDENAVRFESGLTAEALADGRADVAVQQLSELRSVPGEHISLPIPHELQDYGRFAIGARPKAPAEALAFLTMLTAPRARQAFESVGLETPKRSMDDTSFPSWM